MIIGLKFENCKFEQTNQNESSSQLRLNVNETDEKNVFTILWIPA